MKHKLTLLKSISLLFFFLISTSLFAQNLVTNGGFGTNDLTNWSETVGYNTDASSGSAVLLPGDLASGGYMYQDLDGGTALTANSVYEGSIDLDYINTGPNGLQVGIYDASDNMVYSHEFTSTGTHTFSFTPTSSVVHQIRLAGGVGTVTVTIDNVSVTENVVPTATPTIVGTEEVGYTLTATPVLHDDDGDSPLTASYQWYRANTSTTTVGISAISGATAATYVLTADDAAKYIFVKVIPYAATGNSPGAEATSNVLGPVVANTAPYFSTDPAISGTEKQGSDLTLTYTVSDAEDNPGADVVWYRSSDVAGVNKIEISGASSPYTLVYADVGKYIIVEVTPTADAGVTPGTMVSATSGSIAGYALGIPTTTAPVDEATKVVLTPSFSWDDNLGRGTTFDSEDQYELEVATDNLFGNVVYNITNIGHNATGGVHTATVPLDLNTKYYWRVRAKLSTSSPIIYSPWSQTKTFTTTVIGESPTQTYPIAEALVYTNTPTFYWYTGVASDDQEFEIIIGTNDYNGSGNVPTIAGTNIGSDLSYEIPSGSELTPGTDYYWWVRATDGTNVSDWSEMGEFTTSSTNSGPVVPVGTYPIGGALQYSNSPTLYWYVLTQVTGLEFEVFVSTSDATPGASPTTSGNDVFYNATPVGDDNFFAVSGLTSNTTYYWWVRSTDGTGNSGDPSAWSERYSFVTTASSGSPVKPVLTYPIGGATVSSAEVNLYWYATTVATDLKYDLYYNNDGTTPTAGTTPVETGITTSTTTMDGLVASTTYHWWIRSTDANGLNPSEWSDEGSFVTSSTVAVVSAPVPISPTGGTVISGTTADLSWAYYGTGNGITYELQYSLYPNMDPLATSPAISIVDPSATTYELSGLATGTTYYWQVRANDNSGGQSAWSSVATFSTLSNATFPLVIPRVGSPIANVVLDTNSPELSWFLPSQSVGLTYELQYSVNSDFSDVKELKDINKTSATISSIENGEKYFWRVRSKSSDGGVSIYSAIGSFIGQGVTDVKESSIVPEKFEVSQNYPNPFNPSTVIKYSSPETSFVTIRVYNMLGQEIATLVNEEINAGVHNVTWNGMSDSGVKVATGTYIYRVVAGSNIVTKKMILLK